MACAERAYVMVLPVGLPWHGVTVTDSAEGVRRLVLSVSAQAAAPDHVASRVREQLLGYFADPSYRFTLTIDPQGTPFQHKVWQAIQAIPVGETRSYGELARSLGSASQAVGNACRANPLPIIIPCHRVVAARGLGGYFGATDGAQLAAKRWLLRHEGCHV